MVMAAGWGTVDPDTMRSRRGHRITEWDVMAGRSASGSLGRHKRAAAAQLLVSQTPELVAVFSRFNLPQAEDQGQQILGAQLPILLPLQSNR